MEDDGTDGPAFLCLSRNQSRQSRPPEMPYVGRSADSTITKPFNLTEMQNPDMRRFRATDNTLYFNTRDELVRVPLDRVAYFETDSNYCDVIFINGLRATLLTSLSNIEQILLTHFTMFGTDRVESAPVAKHIDTDKVESTSVGKHVGTDKAESTSGVKYVDTDKVESTSVGKHVESVNSIPNPEGRGSVLSFLRVGKRHIINLRYLIRLDIPRQRLILSDLRQASPLEITVSREALRILKQHFT